MINFHAYQWKLSVGLRHQATKYIVCVQREEMCLENMQVLTFFHEHAHQAAMFLRFPVYSALMLLQFTYLIRVGEV